MKFAINSHSWILDSFFLHPLQRYSGWSPELISLEAESRCFCKEAANRQIHWQLQRCYLNEISSAWPSALIINEGYLNDVSLFSHKMLLTLCFLSAHSFYLRPDLTLLMSVSDPLAVMPLASQEYKPDAFTEAGKKCSDRAGATAQWPSDPSGLRLESQESVQLSDPEPFSLSYWESNFTSQTELDEREKKVWEQSIK